MAFSLESLKKNRQLQLALGATIFLLAVIVFLFMSNADYFEKWHEFYFVAAIFGLGLLFWGLKTFRIIVLIPAALIICIAVGISMLKFDWRKAYILDAQAGQPFIFEEYIDEYPSLEEYVKASFFGGPNWIAFAGTCGERADKGLAVPPSCTDLESIKAEFGLDMQRIVEDQYKLMRKTAKRIEKGQLTDPKRYEQCLARGQCAIVPMLPPDVDPETLKAEDFSDIRNAFWALIEKEKLNKDVCNHMKLCYLLVQMGALKESSF